MHTFFQLSSYPEGLRWETPLLSCSIGALFRRSAKDGDRVFAEQGTRSLTYREADLAIDATARGLIERGVKQGDRVGLLLQNGLHFPIAFLAILRLGGVVVGLAPLDAPRETQAKIADSGIRVVIADSFAPAVPSLHTLVREGGLDAVVIAEADDFGPSSKPHKPPHPDGFLALLQTKGAAVVEPEGLAEALAVLQYTGGTTGELKAAEIEHRMLSRCGDTFARWMNGLENGRETSLVSIPLVFTAGLSALFIGSLATGSRMVLQDRLDVPAMLAKIQDRRITWMTGVPTLFAGLLAHPDFDKYDLSSLKYCLCGSAPLPRTLQREFERRTGCRMMEGYGMTECTPITCTPTEQEYPFQSVGVAMPGVEVRILDIADAKQQLATGATGQIAIRGPSMMRGYWQRPDLNEQVFIDGFFLTGDVGRVDDDGYLFLSDRLKDIIITSGVNVYPGVVEQAIYEHPDIEEAIVLGIPDEYRGQIVKAFVKLRRDSRLEAVALTAFLSERLGKHELPRIIEFRAALPRTAVGKLSRKDLIAEVSAA